MYPLHFANLFPPFPRNNKVFVAMSFAKDLDHRWEHVIKPGIERVAIGADRLEAYRVNASVVGDSILTEILNGITNARLVFADVSTMHVSSGVPFRNANVMYEVGIAHSLRLPEEVLLFRSDRDRLMFDLANVRVNEYSPDADTAQAATEVRNAVFEAIKELDLRKSAYVQRAADALDGSCCDLLMQAMRTGLVPQPAFRTMGDVAVNSRYLAAISRMLELGILKFEGFSVTKDTLEAPMSELDYSYRLTDFGRTVFSTLLNKSGWNSPEVQQHLAAMAITMLAEKVAAAD